jgi:hypothetical protein
MDAVYAIPAAIVIITAAVSILGKHKKINSFFKRNQWMYIIIFICLVVFAFALAFFSGQTKEATSMAGTLEPIEEVVLSATNNNNPEVEIGRSGTVFKINDPTGRAFSDIFKSIDLTILKENGKLKTSVNIRNRDGELARIQNNNFRVNPSGAVSFDRNYNDSALEVQDKYGEIVLQIVYVNQNRIQLQGKFYDENGNGMALIEAPDFRGALLIKRRNYSEFDAKIKPIFKYPSNLFFGTPAD